MISCEGTFLNLEIKEAEDRKGRGEVGRGEDGRGAEGLQEGRTIPYIPHE